MAQYMKHWRETVSFLEFKNRKIVAVERDPISLFLSSDSVLHFAAYNE